MKGSSFKLGMFFIALLLSGSIILTFDGQDIGVEALPAEIPAHLDFLTLDEDRMDREISPERFVITPDGKEYEFYSSLSENGEIWVGVSGINGKDKDYLEIGNVPFSYSYDFEYSYFFLSDDSTIIGIIYLSDTGSEDQFAAYMVTIPLSSDPDDITTNIMEVQMMDKPHAIGVRTIQDQHMVYFSNETYLTIRTIGIGFQHEYTMKMSGLQAADYDLEVLNDNLVIFYQSMDRSLDYVILDKELSKIDEGMIAELGSSIGFDNNLESMIYEDSIYLFFYRDELSEYRFDSLEYFIIESDMDVASSGELSFPDGSDIRGDLFPYIYDDEFLILDGGLETINRFDMQMELVGSSPLIWPEDEGFWGSGFRDQRYYTYQDGLILFLGDGNQNFITSSNITGGIPPYGSLIIDDIREFKGVIYLNNRYLEINGELIFKDANITLEFTDIRNYGILTFIDSSVHLFDYRDSSDIENYGTMHFIRGSSDITIENSGDLVIEGNIFSRVLDHWIVMDGGDLEFRNVLFSDPSLGTYDEIIDIERYSGHDSWVYFNDCTFSSLSRDLIVPYGDLNVEFISCKFLDTIFRQYRYHSVRSFKDCVITGTRIQGLNGPLTIQGCNIEDNSSISASDGYIEIIDSDLTDCYRPFFIEEHSDSTYVSVSKSRFEDCDIGIDLNFTYNYNIMDNRFVSCKSAVVIGDGSYGRITDNYFRDCGIAVLLSMDEDDVYHSYYYFDLEPEDHIITENWFMGKGSAILFRDHYFFARQVTRYDWDQYQYDHDYVDSVDSIEIGMLDARYNHFDTKDPKETASKLSPGIYFLPYFGPDDELVSTDDNDMDGLRDNWEIENGLDPSDLRDAFVDHDMDHYSTYEEYRSGTDPFDSSDKPSNAYKFRVLVSEIFLILVPLIVITTYVFFVEIMQRKRGRDEFTIRYQAYKRMRDSSPSQGLVNVNNIKTKELEKEVEE